MTTVQQVYDMAIHLMDEQNESTGATQTEDTREYEFRTISILNTAIPALYPYSSNYNSALSGRPLPSLLFNDDISEPDFEQTIPLDDSLAVSLLPFYLASQLLSSENEALAAWFLARYSESFREIRDKMPAQFESISMPYGAF